MNTKMLVAAFERNEFDAEAVCSELLTDAANLVRARNAKEPTAVRACYTEQLQKYDSAVRKYSAKSADTAAYDLELMRNMFCRDPKVKVILGSMDRVERAANELAEKLKADAQLNESMRAGLSARFTVIQGMLEAGDEDIRRAVTELQDTLKTASDNAALSFLSVAALVRDISTGISKHCDGFINIGDWNDLVKDFTKTIMANASNTDLIALGFSVAALDERWIKENFNTQYSKMNKRSLLDGLVALHLLGNNIIGREKENEHGKR